jgi:RNA polymerase sigma-70 factor (ECF subfamily)
MTHVAEGTDDRLATAFVAGADGALEAVYSAHGSLIFTYCRRVVGPERAADATQETFLAAWRSRDRYRPEAGSLAGWLMGIARFKAIDVLRTEGRQPSPAIDVEAQASDRSVSDGSIDSLGERMLIADALDQLPARARDLVRLAFFDGLTHAEISERSGVPLGTVKSDIRRGLERMRRHLEGFDDAGAT